MTLHIARIPNGPSLPKSRKVAHLPSLLDRRVAAYALVATAAGVSAPAFAQAGSEPTITPTTATGVGLPEVVRPRPNAIVYTSVNIPFIGSNYQGKSIGIDFNGDGVKDLTIQVYGRGSHTFGGSPSYLSGQAHWFGSAMRHALASGDRIGPPANFQGQGLIIRSVWAERDGVTKGTCWGAFRNVQSMYLGVRFSIDGETHFGWVRLNANCGNSGKSTEISGTVTGYAYNTIANERIDAGQQYAKPPEENEEIEPTMPEPGTLGALSLGSVARRP